MYVAESVLTLDDKVSKSLQQIIGKVETAHKAFMDLRGLIESTDIMLGTLSKTAKEAATTLGGLAKAIGGINTRLNTTEQASTRAASGLERFEVSGLQTTNTLAGMTMQAERLNMAMGSIANSARAANAATRGMGFGRGFGGGGGGHFTSRMTAREGALHGAASAVGMHRGVGGFMSEAFNASIMGMIGMDIAKEAFKPGIEYVNAQNKFNTVGTRMASESDKRMAKKEAERIATQVGFASPSEVMEDIWHMFGVTKNMPMAIMRAEQMTKGETLIRALGSSHTRGHERELSSSILRAAEQTGNIAFDPSDLKGMAKFDKFLDNSVKMLAISGGNITPQSFKNMITTARSARIGVSDQTMFADMAFFLSEMGGKGGRAGTTSSMFQQLSRHFQLGNLNQVEASKMIDLGLMGGPDAQRLKKELSGKQFGALLKGMKGRPDKMIKDFGTMEADPLSWILDTWLPAVLQQQKGKLGGGSPEQLKAKFSAFTDTQKKETLVPYVQGMGGNLTDLFLQTVLREKGILEERKRFGETPGADEMFGRVSKQLGPSLDHLNASFKTLAEIVGDRLSPVLKAMIQGVDSIVGSINKGVVSFDQEFPHISKLAGDIGWGFEQVGKGIDLLLQFLGMGGRVALHQVDNAMGGGPTPPFFQPPPISKGGGGSTVATPFDPRIGNPTPRGFPPPPMFVPPPKAVAVPAGTHMAPDLIAPGPTASPGHKGHGGTPPISINQTFHGPADPRLVASATTDAVTQALARHQLLHNATVGRADGNWNTPLLNGSIG